jgi:hypothetical protein
MLYPGTGFSKVNVLHVLQHYLISAYVANPLHSFWLKFNTYFYLPICGLYSLYPP